MALAQSFTAGVLIGVTMAICRELLLALAAAIWLRRPRPVAVAAMLGVAAAELLLCVVGVAAGSWVRSAVPDEGSRSAIAVGLLVGVAAWLVVGAVIGRRAVPGTAALPTRPLVTWARFAIIGLASPIPGIIVGANVLVWPGLTVNGAGVALVVGAVAAALVIRWQWSVAAARNRGVRSTRWMHSGLWIGGILLISVFVISIVGR